MEKCKILTIANEKGGVGKTTTCRNLGSALLSEGMRVLLVDLNQQANLTLSVGIENPGLLPMTIGSAMNAVMTKTEILGNLILQHNGIDIIPANKSLTVAEVNLAYEACSEVILAEILDPLREQYDYILIDTGPTTGKLINNALVASDSVLIPISPEFWSATGFTELVDTVSKIKRRMNPRICIEGVLLTMCEVHTVLYRRVKEMLEECTFGKVKIFDSIIPRTTKVGRANMHSLSIADYDAKNPAAVAYANLAKEVIGYDAEGSNANTATA